MIARTTTVVGNEAAVVAAQLAAQLRDDGLRLVLAFVDWRLDTIAFARELQRALGTVPVAGCTTIGLVGEREPTTAPAARAVGFYGDWLRVGIGVASELPKSPLARSRDAVHHAAAALGTTPNALDPARHVALTLVDGSCGHEEAFCIGSAAAAPQIEFVGGSAAGEFGSAERGMVWANGEALSDAGVVVVLESALPFHVVTSSHLVPTDLKTVVTAASGRVIEELDGQPATPRLRALVGKLGAQLSEGRAAEFSFARFVDGRPYVRSIVLIEPERIHLASAVEPGHVLRVMRPGDLIGVTRDDLAAAAHDVGGELGALVAFSCLGRHWEASARGIDGALAEIYAGYPTSGFQSFGEQTGMLLVNHTLTALAIGARR